MQLVVNILVSFTLYSVIAYSFSLIYNLIKGFHLAHAISISSGSYFTYLFHVQLNLPLLPSIIGALVLGMSFIPTLFYFCYRPVLSSENQNWKLLIVSIGLYLILQNLTSIIWGNEILVFGKGHLEEGFQLFGAYISKIQLITIFTNIFILFAVSLIMRNSKIGKEIKAVSSNPVLSEVVGISEPKTIFFGFVLGSGIALAVGILISADTGMTPTMGFNWLLYGVVAMIIGGMGKSRYVILGALLLATAQHLSAYYFDSKWMNATAYIILVAFLIFRPYGFSGQPLKKAEI